MPDHVDSVAFMLGKIEGQLRELIHQTASTSQNVTAMGLRIAALEAELNQRKGASSLMSMLLKSPALGWIVGAGTTVYLFLTGKLHI